MLDLVLAAALFQADACYTSEDFRLSVPDPDAEIVIAGELRRAVHGEDRPVIIMVTGSGPHVREQVISGVPMFGMIADALTAHGYNVVMTDLRGFGASTINGETLEEPRWLSIPTPVRVSDNRQILQWASGHSGLGDRLMLGHSEGAMIAAQLGAAGDAELDGVILLSGSTLPGDEVWARQRTDFMVRNGVEAETAEALYPLLLVYARFVSGPDRDDDAAYEALAARLLDAQSGYDEVFYDRGFLDFFRNGTDWHRAFMGYDPADDLARLTLPVLAIWGSADDATPPSAHAPALAARLAEAGNVDHAIHVLPDQDHFFLEFEGVRVDRHPYGQTEIASELINVLIGSLDNRYGTAPRCGG